MTSSNVLKTSGTGKFDPVTLHKAGGFVRLLQDDSFSFFLELFHHIMPHMDFLYSQLQKYYIDSAFVNRVMQKVTDFRYINMYVVLIKITDVNN